MTVLEVKNVSYSYDRKKNILKDLYMQLEAGKMYAILGPSGSGKTTLLSLLGGLDEPTSGNILINGEDIMDKGLSAHRRNHTALIFQSYNLIDYMTAIQNAKLMARKEALPILEKLGLTREEANRNVLKLSGGQQQRVAIARALASDAPILLADEPTGNLDEDTAAEITNILKESAHVLQKCVVVVTHSNDVAKQADVILKLKRGNVQISEQI